MTASLRLRAAVVSIVLLAVFLGAWHLATRSTGTAANMSPEYAKLMGMTATQGKSAMPGPLDVGAKLWEHLKRPFYDNGPNDKGLGIQLAFSLGRVMLGYLIAVAIAIPLGFLIGMSPLMSKALDPFIQIMKPISPLAWMPLALYTIKDSSLSAIFVIFICSVWPMLINTAFGVASVRKEWINVARTLEVGNVRRADHADRLWRLGDRHGALGACGRFVARTLTVYDDRAVLQIALALRQSRAADHDGAKQERRYEMLFHCESLFYRGPRNVLFEIDYQ